MGSEGFQYFCDKKGEKILIKIALDAMGGDYAPAEIVKGAVLATSKFPISVFLCGNDSILRKELKKHKNTEKINIAHAEETIGMNEVPTQAVKQKKDASINVAVKLVKTGKADAVVSAGNTGALMTSALLGLGRIRGVERPAIATFFPTTGKTAVLLLDMGANVDCKPKQLKQFSEMGSIYAEHVLHIKSPRVGLLNIGEEPEKGNELTIAAYKLLKEAHINFIGNIESKEIFSGDVDVVVCDGFIGNLILKFGESAGKAFFGLFKKELKKHPFGRVGAFLLLPVFLNLKKVVEYDEYGGAPLLGIAGVVIKAHGRAKARAIKNAIGFAYESVKEKIIENIGSVETK